MPAWRREERPWRWLLLDIGGSVAAGVVVVVVVIAFAQAASPSLGYMAQADGLLILAALAVLIRNVRRNRVWIALNYLEQAVRLNLPLPAMIHAAEQVERPAVRRRLEALRNFLEEGAPVAAAVTRAMPATPQRVAGLIWAGERVGHLPQALARAVARNRSRLPANHAQAIFVRWYPITMLLSVAAAGGVIMVFVMPKYEMILRSFGLPIPTVTALILEVARTAAVPIAVVGGLVVALACGQMLVNLLPSKRPPSSLLASFVDRVAWVTPVLGAMQRSRGMADVCYVLADALEVGYPLDRALTEAGELRVNVVLRNRIRAWTRHVESGLGMAEAARKANLPPMLTGMLATAQGGADAVNVFRFLARYYDSRFSAAAAMLEGAAVPAMVLAAAICVAALALGIFVPIVDLVKHLSLPRGPM